MNSIYKASTPESHLKMLTDEGTATERKRHLDRCPIDVHLDTTHFTVSLLGRCLNLCTNASHTSLSHVNTGL
jgi:hypothetical protein